MSWASTEPKKPKDMKDRDIVNSEDEDFHNLPSEERDRILTSDFLDEDYMTRMPSTRFANLKHIENLVL